MNITFVKRHTQHAMMANYQRILEESYRLANVSGAPAPLVVQSLLGSKKSRLQPKELSKRFLMLHIVPGSIPAQLIKVKK